MWPRGFVLLILVGAGLAACSGSFGSTGTMPQTLSSPNFGVNPTPAPSPSSASAVLTYGDRADFQELPSLDGFSGAIAFPTAGPATPAPSKGKNPTPAPSPTAVEIAIGVTLSIHKPEDGPDLNLKSGKGKHRKGREHPARPLAYIELLPTHDATLSSYPRIAIDIPRDIVTEYRDGEFGMALWNSGEKDSVYRLAVEKVDTTATPPPAAVAKHPAAAGSPAAGATPSPSPTPSGVPQSSLFTPTPTPTPTRMPNGQFPTNPPGGVNVAHGPQPSAAPTLPPQRILFVGTAQVLKLLANRPAIFAIYALPEPAESPTPAPSGKPGAAAVRAGSPEPGASGATKIEASAPPQTLTATSAPQTLTATAVPQGTLTSAPAPAKSP